MDLFAAMRKRRMHRAFVPEPVPRELLEKLVYAAGRAATARAGIRHQIVVDDPGLMATFRPVFQASSDSCSTGPTISTAIISQSRLTCSSSL